jgi:heme exporter protein A
MHSNSSRPVLAAQGLACRRGGEILFSNLSFQVFPGQVVWLQGHNGRGKTSLLRLIVGLAQPEQGKLIWDFNASKIDDDFRSNLVYIGHTNGLKDDLTVAESVQFLARLHGREYSHAAVAKALSTLSIQHRAGALVRTLSQGQRRRAALSRLTLERDPCMWVLDEPFDALDAQGIGVVNDLLLAHAARGGSVLLTSHLPLRLKESQYQTLDFHQSMLA